MKLTIKIAFIAFLLIINSCAPAGLTPEERVGQFNTDVETNGTSLGHNFNSAAEMYHEVFDRDNIMFKLFNTNPGSVTAGTTTYVDDYRFNVLFSDGSNNWLMQLTLEPEIYSAFWDDYTIKKIEVEENSMNSYIGFY